MPSYMSEAFGVAITELYFNASSGYVPDSEIYIYMYISYICIKENFLIEKAR